MTYFGGWYAQSRIWDSANIGEGLVEVTVILLRQTAQLVNKTVRTIMLNSGIRLAAHLTDKTRRLITMKE